MKMLKYIKVVTGKAGMKTSSMQLPDKPPRCRQYRSGKVNILVVVSSNESSSSGLLNSLRTWSGMVPIKGAAVLNASELQ